MFKVQSNHPYLSEKSIKIIVNKKIYMKEKPRNKWLINVISTC